MTTTKLVIQVYSDKGPLKDKGELTRWRAEVNGRLGQLHKQMLELATQTRAIRGWRWSLVRQRSIRGACQLRWRTADWQHVTWQDVQCNLQGVPPALAQWYRETHVRVQVLNTQEQVARYELLAVQRLESSLVSADLVPGELNDR